MHTVGKHEQPRRAPRLAGPRRAWPAGLAALAGGVIVAVGLGALPNGSLGAQATAGSPPSTGESAATSATSNGGTSVQEGTVREDTATVPQGAASTSSTAAPATTPPTTASITPTTTPTATPTTAAATPAAPAPTPATTSGPTSPSTSPLPSTSTTPSPTPPQTSTSQSPSPELPIILHQRSQKITPGVTQPPSVSGAHGQPGSGGATSKGATGGHSSTGTESNPLAGTTGAALSGPNNVALPPQLAAGAAGALAAELASSAASAQALSFYRIPLFLLPIYQTASLQYGVPWQILAAINEIETNYGTDQSVSTAGAVGWMQFMPATWTSYGVDAFRAGYADPYNPVDAIFAAARYLRAAGVEQNLRTAILAYNHSEEYADSVLLRAKLISTYPQSVIAALTALIDERPPVSGRPLAWGALRTLAAGAAPEAAAPTPAQPKPAQAQSQAPEAPAPTPTAAAAQAKAPGAAKTIQLIDLLSAPAAKVLAVQDGRIVKLGSSRRLGSYVILRDLYGDEFTYAGLGSIAKSYRPAKPSSTPLTPPAATTSTAKDPAPSRPASAGRQLPLTLHVKSTLAKSQEAFKASEAPAEVTPAGMGKVRLFAHPGNPDARAASKSAQARAAASKSADGASQAIPLRKGTLVPQGTVLGRVSLPQGASAGHLQFAIRPAGDPQTIDPRPILSNWVELYTALHPRGAKQSSLSQATAGQLFVISKSRLQSEILSDPGITASPCSRSQIASGAIDARVLALDRVPLAL